MDIITWMRSIDALLGITPEFAMGFGFGLMFMGVMLWTLSRNYKFSKKASK